MQPITLLALSAALQALSLSKHPPFFIGFVALAPIIYLALTQEMTLKRALTWGYLEGLFFSFFVTPWLIDTFIIYGHLPPFAAVILLFLYSIIACGRFVLFFLLTAFWKKRLSQGGGEVVLDGVFGKALYFGRLVFQNRYLALTSIWGLSEILGWQLFPVLAGNLFNSNEIFIQFADLVGVRGVSLVGFFFNLAALEIIVSLFRTRRPTFAAFAPSAILPAFAPATLIKRGAIFGGLLLVILIYGVASKKHWQKVEGQSEKINIGVVQGNSPLAFESVRSLRESLWNILEGMNDQTRQLAAEAELMQTPLSLIIWPESGVPFLSYQGTQMYYRTVEELKGDLNIPMIINDVYAFQQMGRRVSYNNLWYLEPNGESQNYQKNLLLPFGEFMPLGRYFPKIVAMFPEVSNFTPGAKKTLLRTNKGLILPSICYELMTPDFTLDYFFETDRKANMVVNITNDAWFGDSIENFQHLMISRFRAIELRLPVIRSTNSGISAYIAMSGEIIDPTKSMARENRIYKAPIVQGAGSLFSKTGNLFFYFFIYINLLLWALHLLVGNFEEGFRKRFSS